MHAFAPVALDSPVQSGQKILKRENEYMQSFLPVQLGEASLAESNWVITDSDYKSKMVLLKTQKIQKTMRV